MIIQGGLTAATKGASVQVSGFSKEKKGQT